MLKSNPEKDSSADSVLEKQLRTKYVLSWNELAIAYQQNKMYSEALEAFQTAITVYQKLNLKIHQTFAQGDFFLTKLFLKQATLEQGTAGNKESLDNTASLYEESPEIMIPAMDFASELNVYLLLVRVVYN